MQIDTFKKHLLLGFLSFGFAHAQGPNCFVVLNTAHTNLGKRLLADDQALRVRNTPSTAAALASQVSTSQGSVLKSLLSQSHLPVVERTRFVEPMSPLQRAVHDRLFVVQDFLLRKGTVYIEFMRARHGIHPESLEISIKEWIDARFDRVVRDLSRDSMRQERLAELEAELNDVAADVNALAKNGYFRDELVARYKAHEARVAAQEAAVAGIGVVGRIIGKTNDGVVVPEPYPPRDPPAIAVVPKDWKPLQASPFTLAEDVAERTPAVEPVTTVMQVTKEIPPEAEVLPTPASAQEGDLDVPASVFERAPRVGLSPRREQPLRPIAPTGPVPGFQPSQRPTPYILTLPPQNVQILPDDWTPPTLGRALPPEPEGF